MRAVCSYILITVLLWSTIAGAGTLESDFRTPPRDAGVRCWWWWLNSNVTRASRGWCGGRTASIS